MIQKEVLTHFKMRRCGPDARSFGVEDGSFVDIPGSHQANAPVNFCKVEEV